MLKNKFLAIFAIGAAFAMQSCGDKNEKTSTGLEYTIHKDDKGENAKFGDYISIKLKIFSDKDSLLMDSYANPQPIEFILEKPKRGGAFEEALVFLSKGDSATIKVPVDSMFTKENIAQKPPFLKSGSFITYVVKVVDVMGNKELAKKRVDFSTQQIERIIVMPEVKALLIKDSIEIAKYLSSNKLVAKNAPYGIKLVITKEGTGEVIEAGDVATMHYTGKLLNGKVFDSSVERGQPFPFNVGFGEVIPGWDFGIKGLKVGTKATLLIPSVLGYGQRGAGDKIPANAILVFDIEVVKKGK